MIQKPIAIKDYVFKKDLHDTPLTLSTIFYNKSWVTILENVPTLTFRGSAFKQDVIGVHKTYREAKKFHADKLKEIDNVTSKEDKKNA